LTSLSELRRAAAGERTGAAGRADIRLIEEAFEVLHDAGVGIDLGGLNLTFGDTGGPTNGEVVPGGVMTPVAHVPHDSPGFNDPVPVIPPGTTVITGNGGGVTLTMAPGDDLRDFVGPTDTGGQPQPVAQAGPVVAIALRLLRALMGTATRVTAQHWGRLPGWAQSLLSGVGIGVGFDLALDIPGVPGESGILGNVPGLGGGGGELAHMPSHLVDGHLGAHIIGSWVANGVTFYRLSDGKLAVQNKLGRWKVWRPKKPIVIMPGGANNLRTLLRADAVLNRQSKKIASMLNRRAAGRRPRAAHTDPKAVVVVTDGHKVT